MVASRTCRNRCSNRASWLGRGAELSSCAVMPWLNHQAHMLPSTTAAMLAIHIMTSCGMFRVGGGAKHVGHPRAGCRKWPFSPFFYPVFLSIPKALVALHVLFDQELPCMPVHGCESLRSPLSIPPSVGGPCVSELDKFVPQGVYAFSRQAGRQNDMGRGPRRWHRQEMQGLGIRSGRKLA